MKPLIIGPSVCPTSIIMSKRPIDAPVISEGASSLTKAGVTAVTAAKPRPYTKASMRRIQKSDTNGIKIKGRPETTHPSAIGVRLPVLSDTLPM